MSHGRFEKLEKERTPAEDVPARPSSVEGRFAEPRLPTPPEDTGNPGLSGAAAVRFEAEPAAGGIIRLLDLEQGQSFLRCCRCRADNYVTASRCEPCGADLQTREQRAFNEAFWKKRLEAEAEEKAALDEARARRAQAEREDAEALRRRAALEQELQRRRGLGLPLDDEDDVSQPLRAVGRAVGQWLRRSFPDRRHRLAALLIGGSVVLLLLASLFSATASRLGWRAGYVALFVLLSIVSAWLRRRS